MAPDAANTPATSTPEEKPGRHWYQYSLRTALLLMFLASVFFAGFAWRRNRAERQRKIVAELRERGAGVEYGYFSFTKPKSGVWATPDKEFFLCSWLRRCLGDDFVYDVDRIWYTNSTPIPIDEARPVVELIKSLPRLKALMMDGDAVRRGDLEQFQFLETLEVLNLTCSGLPQGGLMTDDDLVPLERAVRLQHLSLRYQPIGDAGIAYLRNSHHLSSLLLLGTSIGNEGLAHFSEMKELEVLWLDSTRVTDAGLKNLQEMKQLRHLDLSSNAIQGSGLADIGSKPKLTYLNLSKTQVDDAALLHLANFPQLQELLLSKTQVTGSGLHNLTDHKKLTGICLVMCPVTDASLAGFVVPPHWEVLNLSGTKITDQGVLNLKIPAGVNTICLGKYARHRCNAGPFPDATETFSTGSSRLAGHPGRHQAIPRKESVLRISEVGNQPRRRIPRIPRHPFFPKGLDLSVQVCIIRRWLPLAKARAKQGIAAPAVVNCSGHPPRNC